MVHLDLAQPGPDHQRGRPGPRRWLHGGTPRPRPASRATASANRSRAAAQVVELRGRRPARRRPRCPPSRAAGDGVQRGLHAGAGPGEQVDVAVGVAGQVGQHVADGSSRAAATARPARRRRAPRRSQQAARWPASTSVISSERINGHAADPSRIRTSAPCADGNRFRRVGAATYRQRADASTGSADGRGCVIICRSRRSPDAPPSPTSHTDEGSHDVSICPPSAGTTTSHPRTAPPAGPTHRPAGWLGSTAASAPCSTRDGAGPGQPRRRRAARRRPRPRPPALRRRLGGAARAGRTGGSPSRRCCPGAPR